MKYSYKLHGKPEVSGKNAEIIYNDLLHFDLLPGRFTCGWRENGRNGWIEVHPEKISVIFSIEAESAGEFFGALELYRRCVETKGRKTFGRSVDVSGEIYRKMLEQCMEIAQE